MGVPESGLPAAHAKLAQRLEQLQKLEPPSPKRGSASADGHRYDYYAGYGDAFVRDVVKALPKRTGMLLDPWNGAGTTTSIASTQGLTSYGLDANPAAVAIAKARLVGTEASRSLTPLGDDLLTGSVPLARAVDPLCTWFADETSATLRGIERSIFRVLVSSRPTRVTRVNVSRLSPLAALFYVALFRVVRSQLRPFLSTNPTWIRRSVSADEKISIQPGALENAFRAAVGELAAAAEVNGPSPLHAARTRIVVGSSTKLPLGAGRVGAVVTSPPYCTRLDYVIATLPELAVLGVASDTLRELRNSMIGTPTVQVRSGPRTHEAWGETARDVVASVSGHSSRASGTYYLTFYEQYFDGLWKSLQEIARVTRPFSPVVLVAQDSFYKDVHIDLPRVISDMAGRLDWRSLGIHEFRVPTKAWMNTRARQYRTDRSATESVLLFAT